MGCIATLILLWYVNSNLMSNKLYYVVIYGLLFIVAPMIFFVVKIWNAKEKEDFRLQSTVLKWVIFFGILSVLAINLNILYNVKG